MPSSVIRHFEYLPDRKVLRITFVSGNIYDYKDVPEAVCDEMRRSVSKGIYFNKYIKDHYAFEKRSD